ncbi:MAG: hypothetical protein K6E80_06565 [Schwartzia sp.]|nr:hypothetical protein [Schwartzia sp. (in: firmicutes)]
MWDALSVCLVGSLSFLVLGMLAYCVVIRVTECNCKEKPSALTDERERLTKYIKRFLGMIWAVYLVYLYCGADKPWVGDMFANFLTAVCVLFLQEMEQLDNKGVNLWLYAAIGLSLLGYWIAINLSWIGNPGKDVITGFKNYGVPIGVGLIIWVLHDRLKYCLGIGKCYTSRLKCLSRRIKINYYRRNGK